MFKRTHSAWLMAAAMTAAFPVASQAQMVLTHHVREVAAKGEAPRVGKLPADRQMNLDIVLPLKDRAGLDRFLNDLYDPQSASYQRYLTPAQITEQIGPTQAQYDEALR